MAKDFNEKVVYDLLMKYDYLRIAFKAGLLSRRLCQNMLGVTKHDMDDIYVDLVRAGAIKVLSSSAFRATDATMGIIARIDLEKENEEREKVNAGS